jgi:hypothetical protein
MDEKNQDVPIVCDLTVFSAEARQEMAGLPELFRAVAQVRELPDGYAFQFSNESGMFMQIATFVEHERQCCPFYSFALEAEPNHGPFWLRMRGGEGVKEFMDVVWTDVAGAVEKQLIQTGPGDDLDEAVERAAPVMKGVVAGGSKR